MHKKSFGVREWVETVKKDNAAFEAASPAEKRVIIAKDVLLHLQAGRVVPKHDYGYASKTFSEDEVVNIREAMVDNDFRCHGCARAAVVYAVILRRNEVVGAGFDGFANVPEFPMDLFCDIEAAYEAPQGFLLGRMLHYDTDRSMPRELFRRIHDLWIMYTNEEERIRTIMQWIVDHDGEFHLFDFLKSKAPEGLPEDGQS